MEDDKIRRILLASDTHRINEHLEKVFRAGSYDAFVFCGDGEGLENELAFMPGCPADISMVSGNNDYNPGLSSEAVISLGNKKAFLVHGHRYRLYDGLQNLAAASALRECSICLFGHIHRPVCEVYGDVLLINPGSLSEPRQEDRIPTCAVLETDGARLRVRFINGKTLSDYILPESEGRSAVFDFRL